MDEVERSERHDRLLFQLLLLLRNISVVSLVEPRIWHMRRLLQSCASRPGSWQDELGGKLRNAAR